MTGLIVALLLLASPAGLGLSLEARVEGEWTVERARSAFVLGATQPFEELYPRAIFEVRVAREIRQERALAKVFGFVATPELLAREYERIELNTKAPDQWHAVKMALGNDRRLIEEIVCRPLVVDRKLRARFAFDTAVHAEPHGKARAGRARLTAGESVEGVRVMTLSRRRAEAPESTDVLLEKARSASSELQVLAVEPPAEQDRPVSLHPDALRVLEGQFRNRGDVSSILSEQDRFVVYRLLEASGEAWRVEAVFFPKVDFDAWLAAVEP